MFGRSRSSLPERAAQSIQEVAREAREAAEDAVQNVGSLAQQVTLGDFPDFRRRRPSRAPYVVAPLVAAAAWGAWTALLYRGRVVAQQRAFIDSPPERVREVFLDLDRWPEWLPDVSESGWLGREQWEPGSRFRWTFGRMRLVSEVVAPPEDGQVAWQTEAYGFESHDVWEFSPQDGGTLVNVRADESGWPLWLLAPWLQAQRNEAHRRWIEHLAWRATAPELPARATGPFTTAPAGGHASTAPAAAVPEIGTESHSPWTPPEPRTGTETIIVGRPIDETAAGVPTHSAEPGQVTGTGSTTEPEVRPEDPNRPGTRT